MKKIALIGLCLSLGSTGAFCELSRSTTPHSEGPFDCRYFEKGRDAKKENYTYFLCMSQEHKKPVCNYCKLSTGSTPGTPGTSGGTTPGSDTTPPASGPTLPASGGASPSSGTTPPAPAGNP